MNHISDKYFSISSVGNSDTHKVFTGMGLVPPGSEGGLLLPIEEINGDINVLRKEMHRMVDDLFDAYLGIGSFAE